jgi:serine/threonine protein kinase
MEKIERIGEECNYGEIWSASLDKDCNYILKFLSFEENKKEDILREIEIQNELFLLNLAPKIIKSWFSEKGGYIVMERFHTTAANLFVKYKDIEVKKIILFNILSLLQKLHSLGFCHADLHLNNIMVKEIPVKNYKLNEKELYEKKSYAYYFIDFGKSIKSKDEKIRYSDYTNILDHLEDLNDEYPNEEYNILIDILIPYSK